MAAPDNRQVNNKESFVALMDLARTAWAAGDFEKALERAAIAARSHPNATQGVIMMAQSLAALNRVDECMALLRGTIADHAGDQRLLGFARSIATMYGRFDDALASALKLLELNPQDPKSHVYLYLCHTGMGRIDLAGQSLETLSGVDKPPQVAKLSHYIDEYHRLKQSMPALVSAWEACLHAKSAPGRIEESPGEKIPVIQYWSQGDPPADVAQILSNWNRTLRGNGLDEVLLFNRDSALSWIASNAPEFGSAFSGAFHYAMESDIFRIAFASRLPCIYIDIDCWPLEHTAQILKFGIQTGGSMLYFRAYRPWVVNGFFIARPNCPFFSELVKQCRGISYDAMPKTHRTIEVTYGPTRYNKVLHGVLLKHQPLQVSEVPGIEGCSRFEFPESELYFTHEAAVASVKPPFALGYKTTEAYWKGVQ